MSVTAASDPLPDVDPELEGVTLALDERVAAVVPDMGERLLSALFMRIDLALDPPPAMGIGKGEPLCLKNAYAMPDAKFFYEQKPARVPIPPLPPKSSVLPDLLFTRPR